MARHPQHSLDFILNICEQMGIDSTSVTRVVIDAKFNEQHVKIYVEHLLTEVDVDLTTLIDNKAIEVKRGDASE